MVVLPAASAPNVIFRATTYTVFILIQSGDDDDDDNDDDDNDDNDDDDG